jgi:hypothetical protein
MLQSICSFFGHKLNFVEIFKIKGFKLKNVKTQWTYMLSSLKHVMAKYKALIVNMHSNCDKTKFPCENLKLIKLGFAMSHAHVGGGSYPHQICSMLNYYYY